MVPSTAANPAKGSISGTDDGKRHPARGDDALVQRTADQLRSLGGRASAGPPVAQIVYVQAVQDVPSACLRDQLLELGVQVRLAEVAPIDRVAGVAFVIDFVGTDQAVAQAERFG